MNYLRAVISWPIVAWTCYVFLGSLPYKFGKHPDTQHIFGTIGDWIGGIAGSSIGELFSNYGAFAVGGFELLTSVILLLPIVLWIAAKLTRSNFGITRRRFHMFGGLLASAVMAGAVFFHLATPLGVEVLHNGVGDGGKLFFAAVSIFLLGLVLFGINRGWTDRDRYGYA